MGGAGSVAARTAVIALPGVPSSATTQPLAGSTATEHDAYFLFGGLNQAGDWASSMYAAPFFDHGIGARVSCAEVSFGVRKAIVLGRTDVVARLLQHGVTGFHARRLTSKRDMHVEGGAMASWDAVAAAAMGVADFHKFMASQALRTTLLGTAGQQLIEVNDWDLLARKQPGVWSAGITRSELEANIASGARPLYPGSNQKGAALEAVRAHFADPRAFGGFSHYEYSMDAGSTWCGPWPAAAMVDFASRGQLRGDTVRVRPRELPAVDEWRRMRAAASASGGVREPQGVG